MHSRLEIFKLAILERVVRAWQFVFWVLCLGLQCCKVVLMIYQLAVAQLIFEKPVIVFLVIVLLAITTRKNHIYTNIQRFYLTRLTSRADTSITTGIFIFGWWFHVQPSYGRNFGNQFFSPLCLLKNHICSWRR